VSLLARNRRFPRAAHSEQKSIPYRHRTVRFSRLALAVDRAPKKQQRDRDQGREGGRLFRDGSLPIFRGWPRIGRPVASAGSCAWMRRARVIISARRRMTSGLPRVTSSSLRYCLSLSLSLSSYYVSLGIIAAWRNARAFCLFISPFPPSAD